MIIHNLLLLTDPLDHPAINSLIKGKPHESVSRFSICAYSNLTSKSIRHIIIFNKNCQITFKTYLVTFKVHSTVGVGTTDKNY